MVRHRDAGEDQKLQGAGRMSIAAVVQRYLSADPVLMSCLSRGLLNLSALSRRIIVDKKLSNDDFHAVLVALRRIVPDAIQRSLDASDALARAAFSMAPSSSRGRISLRYSLDTDPGTTALVAAQLISSYIQRGHKLMDTDIGSGHIELIMREDDRLLAMKSP